MAQKSSDILPTRIEYHSADLYYTYTMYNPADVRLKRYNVIVLSMLLLDIWTEWPPCQVIPLSYIVTNHHPDYIITVMVEIRLKNGDRNT